MPLTSYFSGLRAETDRRLDRYVPQDDTHPAELHAAIRYSLMAGGKRIRPIMAIAACDAVGGDREKVWPFAASLELIHTYTLIHDDLPALDDDELRRGLPTCHMKFGEATAILAGDGLLTMAFEVMANLKHYDSAPDHSILLKVIAETAFAIGSEGTIGGQVVDLAMEKAEEPDLAALEYIHTHKTGKLIVASVRGGVLLGGGSSEEVEALTEYARNTGLAFQVADDILDVTGDTAQLGKTVGADQERNKLTYPALMGLDESRFLANRLTERAIAALAPFNDKAAPLEELARYIVERTS